MFLGEYLDGEYSREGSRMVHRPVGGNQQLEGSSGEGSLRSLDIVHDYGDDDYDYCPTFFPRK